MNPENCWAKGLLGGLKILDPKLLSCGLESGEDTRSGDDFGGVLLFVGVEEDGESGEARIGERARVISVFEGISTSFAPSSQLHLHH